MKVRKTHSTLLIPYKLSFKAREGEFINDCPHCDQLLPCYDSAAANQADSKYLHHLDRKTVEVLQPQS